MLGVDHRLHDSGVAALRRDRVELLVHGDRVGRDLLRRRVVPLADHFDRVPLLARGLEHFLDALMPVAIDRGAGHPTHLEHLAAVRHVLHQPFGPVLAESLLVDVDVDRLFGVQDVVERHQHDARVVGALDHRLEGCRILRVHHDRVIARVNEIVDRGDLRGDVLAGGDDLELLELRGNVRLRGIGLRRLDHLDAPRVGDVAVGEGDPIRPLLRRVLEHLGIGRPRREALGIGVGRRDHLRRRGGRETGGKQGYRGGNRGTVSHRSLLFV